MPILSPNAEPRKGEAIQWAFAHVHPLDEGEVFSVVPTEILLTDGGAVLADIETFSDGVVQALVRIPIGLRPLSGQRQIATFKFKDLTGNISDGRMDFHLATEFSDVTAALDRFSSYIRDRMAKKSAS